MKLNKNDIKKLQIYNILFKCLVTTFKKNNNDYPNLYNKKEMSRLISFNFGIVDSRSIENKLEFAISNKFIFVVANGYSINQNIEKYYNDFLEKNKKYLLEIGENF